MKKYLIRFAAKILVRLVITAVVIGAGLYFVLPMAAERVVGQTLGTDAQDTADITQAVSGSGSDNSKDGTIGTRSQPITPKQHNRPRVDATIADTRCGPEVIEVDVKLDLSEQDSDKPTATVRLASFARPAEQWGKRDYSTSPSQSEAFAVVDTSTATPQVHTLRLTGSDTNLCGGYRGQVNAALADDAPGVTETVVEYP